MTSGLAKRSSTGDNSPVSEETGLTTRGSERRLYRDDDPMLPADVNGGWIKGTVQIERMPLYQLLCKTYDLAMETKV